LGEIEGKLCGQEKFEQSFHLNGEQLNLRPPEIMAVSPNVHFLPPSQLIASSTAEKGRLSSQTKLCKVKSKAFAMDANNREEARVV
jgi:hypothetical protein